MRPDMDTIARQLITQLFILLLSLFNVIVASKSEIKFLPGFHGDLPFYLETGYIGVGEFDEVQLFYYFIKSERNPRDDPLMLWLTGGPGCSALSGLMYEIGPLTFDYAKSTESKPVLVLNPYSWTKVASIIFLDQPVGTGFSYATTFEAYNVSDTSTTDQIYEFLRKWFIEHQEFVTNPLYMSGDSYGGLMVPMVALAVYNGNKVGHRPPLNLQGYVIGNPLTDRIVDYNSRVPFAFGHGLISTQLYQSFQENCKGEYVNPDTSNPKCMEDIQLIDVCIRNVNGPSILEPKCRRMIPRKDNYSNDVISTVSSAELLPPQWCRNDNYIYIYTWANDKAIQHALHVREGTKEEWVRCNQSLSYTENVPSVVDYHRNLSKVVSGALVYSGDHDMDIPYVGTIKWIESLNLTLANDWAPWFVGGQVAGYKMEYEFESYSLLAYHLTFATVKGAGHTAPEYKGEQCLAMLDRWFAYYPL